MTRPRTALGPGLVPAGVAPPTPLVAGCVGCELLAPAPCGRHGLRPDEPCEVVWYDELGDWPGPEAMALMIGRLRGTR